MSAEYQLTDGDYELISAYIDDALTAAERASFEARLQSDDLLASELEAMRRTVAAVGDLPVLKAPRNFTLTPEIVGQSPANITPLPASRRRTHWMYGAAAAVLVLVVGVGLFLSLNAPGESIPSAANQVAAAPTTAAPQATARITAIPTQPASDAGILPTPTVIIMEMEEEAPAGDTALEAPPAPQIVQPESSPSPMPTQALGRSETGEGAGGSIETFSSEAAAETDVQPESLELQDMDDEMAETGLAEAEESAPAAGTELRLTQPESADTGDEAFADEADGIMEAGSIAPRIIGDKTFEWLDDRWVDTLYDADTMQLEKVRVDSRAYNMLSDEFPILAEVIDDLGTDTHIIIVLDDTAYELMLNQD